MLDKIKKINELKNQLRQEKIELEDNNVKIILNGSLELEQLTLNPNLDIKEQEKIIKKLFNDAVKKAQLNLASKMSQFHNFGF